jgi:hypothetical protein
MVAFLTCGEANAQRAECAEGAQLTGSSVGWGSKSLTEK